MQHTQEQLNAINLRGTNILLSAAAGSGKTTTMVDRILALLEEGADLSKMLVVTFTRAAAGEMKAKLARVLMQRAREDERLSEQLIKLDSAQICTLDAFCADFLRANFEAAGVDPAFTVLDDTVVKRCFRDALDEAMQVACAQLNSSPSTDDSAPVYDVSGLADLEFGRGVNGMRTLVENTINELEKHPEPEEWLTRCTDVETLIPRWNEVLMRNAKRATRTAIRYSECALQVEGCHPSYVKALTADIEYLNVCLAIEDFAEFCDMLSAFKQTSARAKTSADFSEETRDHIKNLRHAAKKSVEAFLPNAEWRTTVCADARAMQPQLIALKTLTLDALRRFSEKKDEHAGVTYADLEHRTLIALKDDAIARQTMQRYDYVFVDEYQDTSDIQEAIIGRIAREDNLFTVGDVKQSIYRFRNAEPNLFLDRYRRYEHGEGGTLLPLTCNFRSKANILFFVNMIFERVMSGPDSMIQYDRNARLNPPPDADSGKPVEIHLLTGDNDAEDEQADDIEALKELRVAEREALLIARLIKQTMRDDPSLHFNDFAVIARAKKSGLTQILPILLKAGIPAYADDGSGYYSSLEVRLGLDLLRITDNLFDDRALIGVVHSPLVGLSIDELTRIRLHSPQGTFAEAFISFIEDEETQDPALRARLIRFREQLDRWQLCAGSVSLGALAKRIFDESGLTTFAAALPGGQQREANLHRLVQMARSFDSNVSGLITRFLKDIEQRLNDDSDDTPQILSESDDVVRLMTIHKSKGLEFPVVIAAKLEQLPNRSKKAFAHRDLGLAPDYYDRTLRTKRVTTLAQTAIELQNRAEDSAESLRILYVLLTRARDRLILTGSVGKIDKALERWHTLANEPDAATTLLDVVMAARTMAESQGSDTYSTVETHSLAELTAPADDAPTNEDAARMTLDAALLSPMRKADPALIEAMRWRDPNADRSRKPLKLTVTGLEREITGPNVIEVMAERPAFMAEDGEMGITANERGTAVHRMLELIDYQSLDDHALVASIRSQMRAALGKRLITDTQYEAINPIRIAQFLESPIGTRLRHSETIRREWSFNLRLRAAEALTPEEADRFGAEELLVQGTIDCCFIEDGQWVLLDYKTNRSTDDEALRAHYRTQIGVYALALERITGIPVKERLLILVAQGRTIRM